MQFRLTCLVLYLACLTTEAAAKSFAAAYEKIWIYWAYELAWEFEGADQKYILRFLDPKADKKWYGVRDSVGAGNRGSGPGGRLNWAEFQIRLSAITGADVGEMPVYSEDYDSLANDIWGSSIRNKMPVNTADSNFLGKPDTEYDEYLHKISDMIRKARETKGDDALRPILDKMNTLTDKILLIRRSETAQAKYLGEDLKKAFPGIKLITNRVTNPGDRNEVWDVVDRDKTLKDPVSEAAIRQASGYPASDPDGSFRREWMEKFIDRVDSYGSKMAFSETDPPYLESAKSHRLVLSAFESCHLATFRGVCPY